MDATYTQGETIAYALADAGYTAAVLHLGAERVALTKTGSTWNAEIASDAMSGRYRFVAIADGKVRESGEIYVKTLVSKYRAVIDAIDSALQGVAMNGKYSINVGEISLTDKTFDEMIKAKNYYSRLADADEEGVTPTFGPRRVSEVYV